MMGNIIETDWIAIEVFGNYFEHVEMGFEIHFSVFIYCLWFNVTARGSIRLRFF